MAEKGNAFGKRLACVFDCAGDNKQTGQQIDGLQLCLHKHLGRMLATLRIRHRQQKQPHTAGQTWAPDPSHAGSMGGALRGALLLLLLEYLRPWW